MQVRQLLLRLFQGIRPLLQLLTDAHSKRSGQLANLYEDRDGARQEELASMSGATVFSTFYDSLKSIREYHRKFPSEPATESAETLLLAEVLESAPDEGFTGEEAERIGLADRLCEEGQAREDAMNYIRMLAETAAPQSIKMIKAQVYRHLNMELEDAMNESNEWMAASLEQDDFKEGVNSFVERRPPNFKRVTE